MSDIRIALVAEGPTDSIIIEAALKAILQNPFVITQLQPEETLPAMGSGWCGVFKWCQQFSQRGTQSIETDWALNQYDLVIVHLDADVADKRYDDCGISMTRPTSGLGQLPCAEPCPPADATVTALQQVLLSWLGIPATGQKSLFCIPSKSIEAWLAAACLHKGHQLLNHIECNGALETQLSVLPKTQRIKKGKVRYRDLADKVTHNWPQIKSICSQAQVFEQEINRRFA